MAIIGECLPQRLIGKAHAASRRRSKAGLGSVGRIGLYVSRRKDIAVRRRRGDLSAADGCRVRRHELSDRHWELVSAVLPRNGRRGGQWRPHRELLNAMFCKRNTGASWRDLPERYGPWQSVYDRFRRWQKDGTFRRLLHRLQLRMDEIGPDLLENMVRRWQQHSRRRAAAGANKGARLWFFDARRRLGIKNPSVDGWLCIAPGSGAERRQPALVLLTYRTGLGGLSRSLASVVAGRSWLQRTADTTMAGTAWHPPVIPYRKDELQQRPSLPDLAIVSATVLPNLSNAIGKAQTVSLHCHPLRKSGLLLYGHHSASFVPVSYLRALIDSVRHCLVPFPTNRYEALVFMSAIALTINSASPP